MHCLSRHLGCQRRGNMNPALVLIGMYIIVTAALQFGGFLISLAVSEFYPSMGLMTFLALFMGMFFLGWPIAVRISERLTPETEDDRQRARDTAEGLRLAGREKARRPDRG
jgi:hypothetical protein